MAKTIIYIATPAYAGPSKGYFRAALRTALAARTPDGVLARAGIDVNFQIPEYNDGLVPRARVSLLNSCMCMAKEGPEEKRPTHLLFVDADIEWQPEDLVRMIATGHDVIGGLYRKRCDELEFPYQPLPQVMNTIDHGVLEVKYMPTGFLMISLRAIERMIAAYPERRCMVEPGGWFQEANKYTYDFFPCPIDDNGMMLSEDFGFCKLWRAAGGHAYALIDIALIHDGHTRYAGTLAEKLAAEQRLTRGDPKGDVDQQYYGTPDRQTSPVLDEVLL